MPGYGASLVKPGQAYKTGSLTLKQITMLTDYFGIIFLVLDDLACLEIVNLINIGISLFDTKSWAICRQQ